MDQTTSPQPVDTKTKEAAKSPGVGVSFPTETIRTSVETVKQLVSHNGSGNYIGRKEATVIIGKSEATVNTKLSTAVQYGLLANKHGKGYIPTELFQLYLAPVYDDDPKKAMIQMFGKPELYSKIINSLNSKILPNEPGFANLLKNDYGVHPNSVEKAAKIFFENARALDIIDANNRLRYLQVTDSKPAEKRQDEEPADVPPTAQTPPPTTTVTPPAQDNLFELPIPLDSKRKAYIRYPLNDLKKKDIKVIVRALSFIASSIIEDDEEEFEIVIQSKKE
ncbi:MAG: hypothetical protein JST68_20225 [Bacteroidetes bacterium]|nr:hypothetical protein [Bacteroidota bacterium]